MQLASDERLAEVRSLDDLRTFIREMLCAQENLVQDQFPIAESLLRRGNNPCGLQFQLHGPRSVRLGAIWAADHNQVYFYSASGERYLKLGLKHRLDWRSSDHSE